MGIPKSLSFCSGLFLIACWKQQQKNQLSYQMAHLQGSYSLTTNTGVLADWDSSKTCCFFLFSTSQNPSTSCSGHYYKKTSNKTEGDHQYWKHCQAALDNPSRQVSWCFSHGGSSLKINFSYVWQVASLSRARHLSEALPALCTSHDGDLSDYCIFWLDWIPVYKHRSGERAYAQWIAFCNLWAQENRVL